MSHNHPDAQPGAAALRVVYMGTPDFAVPALRALLASHHQVVGVFTQPDRPAGRGKSIVRPPAKVVAEEAGVPVYQPARLRRNPEALAQLEAWQPDVVVVAAFGQILPQAILDVPRLGCVNIHASLLPKYRGAAPINWAIVHGEESSGVTLMQMDAGLDTGPMLERHAVPIAPDMNAQQLHDILAELGASVLVDALDRLNRGELKSVAQDDTLSSYAPMLERDTGRVDWSAPAQVIADRIRGLYPWPGSFTIHSKDGHATTLKIHRAQVGADAADAPPGTILAADAAHGCLRVATGQGALELVEVQAPGKRAMHTRDFLNGYPLYVGERFV